jgi:hypothetical protein
LRKAGLLQPRSISLIRSRHPFIRSAASRWLFALHCEIISSVAVGRRFRLAGICCDRSTVRFQSWRDNRTASSSGCSFSAIEQHIRHFSSVHRRLHLQS